MSLLLTGVLLFFSLFLQPWHFVQMQVLQALPIVFYGAFAVFERCYSSLPSDLQIHVGYFSRSVSQLDCDSVK